MVSELEQTHRPPPCRNRGAEPPLSSLWCKRSPGTNSGSLATSRVNIPLHSNADWPFRLSRYPAAGSIAGPVLDARPEAETSR